MHVLPQLRQLEAQFPDVLVVVGVEAGKYPAERVTANIRQAVLRLGVEHPVVNDRHFRTWRSYSIGAWPTLVLIDPAGYIVGVQPGEIRATDFAPLIARQVREYEARGLLDRRPLPFLRPEREPERPLAFPGKVLAAGERLYIADTNHHRILTVALETGAGLENRRGKVAEVIGQGRPGLADGRFDQVAFNRPQGLALAGDTLYVADTENHAVRAIDLARRSVRTIAGSGEQARGPIRPGSAIDAALSSPWDLAFSQRHLFVAMAGTHQLWRLDLASGDLSLHAGSGAEALVDGPLVKAALAQPMGLCTHDNRIYFVDSESSAVRWADWSPGGEVGTIAGTGLFDHGDRDGASGTVRLQHPQGIAVAGDTLYVADTYNNKIKRVDLRSHAVATLFGDGLPGDRGGDEPRFFEPSGLSVLRDHLYVADTNNQVIRIADVTTGRAGTLCLSF